MPKLYLIFATLGLQYGPDYRRLARGWSCTDPNVTLALLHERAACFGVPTHPADVDAAVQLSLLPAAGEQELRLPFAVEQVLAASMKGSSYPSRQRREPWVVSASAADC